MAADGPLGPVSLKNPVHLLALGFGAGLAPVAPGTMGSIVGLLIYLALFPLTPAAYVLTVTAITVAGIWICGIAARDLGVHDHPSIVWDEIAGYLIAMVGAPPGWQWMILGFLLFRLFDIWKPWPIRPIDRRVAGGLGIMLDDVIAAAFAALAMQVVYWVIG
ncbi:MAG: phosphatidylglycerophosphatase A [Gammaproteobacteria bacterium]|nr:phosphatidylglycerophosphatase A [Gammaproteobacteria bacterium]